MRFERWSVLLKYICFSFYKNVCICRCEVFSLNGQCNKQQTQCPASISRWSSIDKFIYKVSNSSGITIDLKCLLIYSIDACVHGGLENFKRELASMYNTPTVDKTLGLNLSSRYPFLFVMLKIWLVSEGFFRSCFCVCYFCALTTDVQTIGCFAVLLVPYH